MAERGSKNRIEVNTFILLIFFSITNFCNYGFQIVTGRYLSVENYGVLNSILAIVNIAGIASTVLATVAARYGAIASCVEREKRVPKILYSLIRLALLVGAVVLAGSVILAPMLSKQLGLTSTSYLILSAVAVAISILAAPLAGTLQGLKRYKEYGWYAVIAAVVKLVGSYILLKLGFEILGVTAGLIMSAVAMSLYCAWCLRDDLEFKASRKSGTEGWSEWRNYLGEAFWAQVLIIIATNIDILLVKWIFTEEVAGNYSAAMVIGKLSMFISNAIISVAFPVIAEKNERREDTRKLYMKIFGYGMVMAVTCSVAILMIGQELITFLYGTEYLTAVSMLKATCGYAVVLTGLNVIMNYQLAVGKVKTFIYTMLAGSVIMVTCLYAWNQNVYVILGELITIGIAIIGINLYNGLRHRHTMSI